MPFDLKSKQQTDHIDFEHDPNMELKTNNNLDKVLIQILIDSKNENDEPLRILKKSLFDSNMSIERLNIDDSVVLKLAYMKKT